MGLRTQSVENREVENKIAYITTSFESLSHTFIRREIEAQRKKGIEIDLYGIRPDGNMPKWKASYLYPINIFDLIYSFFKTFFYNPLGFFKAFKIAVFNGEDLSKGDGLNIRNLFQYFKFIYHFFISTIHCSKIIDREYTHIHAHFLNVPASIAMFCSVISNVPYSITVHSAGEKEIKDINAIKQKFNHSKFIRIISEYIKNDIAGYFQNRNELDTKMRIVKCGIEVKDKDKKVIKGQILAIGRLVEKKGFSYLVNAVDNLLNQGVSCNLIVVGGGPEFENLREISKNKKISFVGAKSNHEVLEYIASSNLVVVPSVRAKSGEKEGIPTVILESMLLNTPVIATMHSGIPEVVIDKQTGILVPEKDIKALSENIKLLLSNDSLCKSLCENAYNFVRKEFDINKTTNELIKLWT